MAGDAGRAPGLPKDFHLWLMAARPEYRRQVNRLFIGFLWAVAMVLVTVLLMVQDWRAGALTLAGFVSVGQSWDLWLSIGTGLFGIKTAWSAARDRWALIADLAPAAAQERYVVTWPRKKGEPARHPDVEARERARILGIGPGPEEARAGFVQVAPGFGGEEIALASERLDDWLTLGPVIPFTDQGVHRFDPARGSLDQQRLLYAKVYGASVTRNDDKLCLIKAFRLELEALN